MGRPIPLWSAKARFPRRCDLTQVAVGDSWPWVKPVALHSFAGDGATPLWSAKARFPRCCDLTQVAVGDSWPWVKPVALHSFAGDGVHDHVHAGRSRSAKCSSKGETGWSSSILVRGE